jgi:hypothetical protein
VTRWPLLCVAFLALGTPAPGAQGDDVAALVKKLNSISGLADGAKSLGKLGASAKTALPDLGKALTRARFQGERVEVARAMEQIVRDVRKALPDLKSDKGKTAAAEIRKLSQGAADDLGDAILKGKATLVDERLAITRAIAACGPDAAGKGVKALASMLTGGFTTNRVAAANALGEIGPAAREAIPALQKASTAVSLETRAAAKAALAKIQAR